MTMNTYSGYMGFNDTDITLNVIDLTIPCSPSSNMTCYDTTDLSTMTKNQSTFLSKYQSKMSPTADFILGCYILLVCKYMLLYLSLIRLY